MHLWQKPDAFGSWLPPWAAVDKIRRVRGSSAVSISRLHPSERIAVMSVQAIAGVSPGIEAKIMTEFPSVGAGSLGRLIGVLMDSIPVRLFGIKLSYLVFGLLVAPLGALCFFLRLLGARYVLTNRSVQIRSGLGIQKTSSAELSAISDVELEVQAGQDFFRAADLRLKAANGQTLLLLPGVADAAAFRNAILRAAEAKRLVQSSLATINARR